jgi:4-hydroxy-3-methylbut-2-enyl diphosphate reductase
VKQIAAGADLVLVLGSQNSSNSQRLVEVALRSGARDALLIDDVSGLDWSRLDGVSTVGVTAGASAPEVLVQGLMDALCARFDCTIEDVAPMRESVSFKLPSRAGGLSPPTGRASWRWRTRAGAAAARRTRHLAS